MSDQWIVLQIERNSHHYPTHCTPCLSTMLSSSCHCHIGSVCECDKRLISSCYNWLHKMEEVKGLSSCQKLPAHWLTVQVDPLNTSDCRWQAFVSVDRKKRKKLTMLNFLPCHCHLLQQMSVQVDLTRWIRWILEFHDGFIPNRWLLQIKDDVDYLPSSSISLFQSSQYLHSIYNLAVLVGQPSWVLHVLSIQAVSPHYLFQELWHDRRCLMLMLQLVEIAT